jgi:replicative DNA helicase
LTNNENTIGFDAANVNMELVFCGCLYKSPDQYIKYGSSVRSKYDFSDEACRFFYDQFEDYYLTFSQEEITENKLNNYMSQNNDRFKRYKSYGGWRTVKEMMNLATVEDMSNAYSAVKKYSLIREYIRAGFPADKLLGLKNFQKLTASDVYRIMRSKCDKINTVISNLDEPIILTDNTISLVDRYLDMPEFGITSCFPGFNEYFRGYLRSKVLFNGCLSNEGKSRYMTKVICDIALKQRKPCLLLSNEQTENDFHNAMITTVVCNPEFQEMHGVKIQKPEKEITMGLYRSDETGEFIYRKVSSDGEILETKEEYMARVYTESSEFRAIRQIAEWIEEQTVDKLIYFIDVSQDYSDENLETQIRKGKLCYNTQYVFYDTMKSWQLEDWSRFKLTATKLCELAKNLDLYMMASFQMTDASAFDDIFELTSNNIGAAKGIKTVCDMLTLCKRLKPEEYHKYQYIKFDDDESWGEPVAYDLPQDKKLFAQLIDKNRLYSRGSVLLYEYNLNENLWNNIGLLVKRDR